MAIPTIAIVILADVGKISKIIKEAAVKHNKIPNVSLNMKNGFFSIKLELCLLLLKVRD